jgi:hypothetical protein
VQVPLPQYRAEAPGLPVGCKAAGNCPLAVPFTGGDQSLAFGKLASQILPYARVLQACALAGRMPVEGLVLKREEKHPIMFMVAVDLRQFKKAQLLSYICDVASDECR